MKEKLNHDTFQRMKEVVSLLNEAGKAYYQEDKEIMCNYQYDTLYDELCLLEKNTGVVLSESPTVHVGYELLSELPKEQHESSMLSLDKTKEVADLEEWIGSQIGVLSWKLDGLTIVLTYQDGTLVKAVTRGNGEIGEVVTNNAKVFKNVPFSIPYKETLIIRGEAVIKYSDFERMNEKIEDIESKYKNPRNLCSGSVRQLNNEITAKRNVHFFAFQVVGTVKNQEINESRSQQLEWLQSMGFDPIEFRTVTGNTIQQVISEFSAQVEEYDVPSDGLVLTYDNIQYGQSLGSTAKFPRHSIAFKWVDETKDTILREIEWSASRTGLINPIAIFDPVELEGTTVSRASLHNISILENLQLGIGDNILVYKANMIIPQIANNLTRSGGMTIPQQCPVCNSEVIIRNENDIKTLYCSNPNCIAKKIKSFTHFVGRDAMNMEGLSTATIEKFIDNGILTELVDLFRLKQHREKIVIMEGFGEKSYQNLIASAENARIVPIANFIYSLGIQNIGLSNAKLICKEFEYDLDKILHAEQSVLTAIPGIGEVIADSFVAYFQQESNQSKVADLLQEIALEGHVMQIENQHFIGKIFVITGSLVTFENRSALKEAIEGKGGKVTGTVTAKTDYLINNDNLSNSSKNKKAKELGIPVITEEEIRQMMEG